MIEETRAAVEEVDGLLGRLQDAHQSLMDALSAVRPAAFDARDADGDSLRRVLERSADDVNFYYGTLVARALSLPQPPMEPADFGSLAEARAGLRLAHRRFSKLLHDLTAADLVRTTRLENTAEYTLLQVLETAVAHYRLRADQIRNAGGGQDKGASNDPRHRR